MVTWQSVCDFAKTLPGLEIGEGYQPGFAVRRRNIGWLREDEETMVVKVSYEERAALTQEHPETFYVTPHYQNFPGVIVRLDSVPPEILWELIGNAWRRYASKRQIREYEGG
jgi:hypothetical protein